MVSASLGRAFIRLVAQTNQPLIGYGLPVIVASRIPVVTSSEAKGYFLSGLSTFGLPGSGKRDRDKGEQDI